MKYTEEVDYQPKFCQQVIFLQNAIQFYNRHNQNEGINCYDSERFLEID